MKTHRTSFLLPTIIICTSLIAYLYYSHNYLSQHYTKLVAADSSASLEMYPNAILISEKTTTEQIMKGERRIYAYTSVDSPMQIGVWYTEFLEDHRWKLDVPAAASEDPDAIRMYIFRHDDGTILNLSLVPHEGVTKIELDFLPAEAYREDKL